MSAIKEDKIKPFYDTSKIRIFISSMGLILRQFMRMSPTGVI